MLSGPPGMPRASRNTRNARNGPGEAPGLFRVLCARKDPERDPERPGKARYHFVQSDLLPPASMLNRYIYYALLRAAIAQINVKLSLRCAQCMLKQDSQLYLKVRTLTTHIVRLRACCFTSATTMDQWSIWWSSCTTSHAHSLLYIHLEPQLTL